MARILHAANGRWYHALRTVAFYGEAELERRILQHAESLFRGYYTFPFKLDVTSRTSAIKKRPDLALIRRDFSAWSLVEVEIKGHSLAHVLEQTSVFLDGDYNPLELAEYARSQLKRFCGKTASLARLKGLFADHAPSIVVLADEDQAAWKVDLSKAGIKYGVFEVYKSVAGQYLYRTFGQYPIIAEDEVHCRRHKSLPNIYEVAGEFTFKPAPAEQQIIEVSIDEYITQWAVFNADGKTYLRFIGRSNPLSPDATYGLVRDKFNRYYFKRN